MKIGIIIILFSVLLFAKVKSQDWNDPKVFDYHYYLHNNPDLMVANLKTYSQAYSHWLNNGIKEGRQAVSTFHNAQYLSLYPDLIQNFGSKNYLEATKHYLQYGYLEGRDGIYLDCAYNGKYTIHLDKKLYVTASVRSGGAIDSINFLNKEYINSFDHGRELQVAMTNGSGECYNPTQAGSHHDFIYEKSTSKIIKIDKQMIPIPMIHGINLPAFWYKPNTIVEIPSENCNYKSINQYINYPFPFEYKIEPKYNWNLNFYYLEYNFNFTLQEKQTKIQFEIPTGYLNHDFRSFKYYNSTLQNLNVYATLNLEINDPIIICTLDSIHCMGSKLIQSPDLISSLKYVGMSFLAPDTSSTTKWSIVWRANLNKETNLFWSNLNLKFKSVICIGNQEMLLSCLKSL